MSKTVYMHTLDGRPAKYWNGKQIVFLSNGMKNVLRGSLKQIRDDQKSTIAWRKKQGFPADYTRFGYKRFFIGEKP